MPSRRAPRRARCSKATTCPRGPATARRLVACRHDFDGRFPRRPREGVIRERSRCAPRAWPRRRRARRGEVAAEMLHRRQCLQPVHDLGHARRAADAHRYRPAAAADGPRTRARRRRDRASGPRPRRASPRRRAPTAVRRSRCRSRLPHRVRSPPTADSRARSLPRRS